MLTPGLTTVAQDVYQMGALATRMLIKLIEQLPLSEKDSSSSGRIDYTGNDKEWEKMITVIGSINMDLVVQTDNFPQQGETTLGQLFTTVPGGKGANQAVAAARLDGRVRMVANVGDDSFGKELIENLKANRVDVNDVMTSPNQASGIANILLSDGDNRIIVVPGANYELNASRVDDVKEIITEESICPVTT